MRSLRIRIEGNTAVYHCISRTVAGARLFGDVEKEVLRKMLWRVAGFSGVEVLAYCIMSNHIHVLVRVPEAVEEELTRAELLRRFRLLYGEGDSPHMPDPAVLEAIFAEPESEAARRWEATLRSRMQNVSEFMKTLKQRFTVWFNHTHKRFGTLWAERFKSTLVENDPVSLKVVAAYVDLNPVRAGMVEDPADYRWSSYGEAMGGEKGAQAGLAAVVGRRDWAAAAGDYRMILFGKGADGRVGEQGILSRERVLAVLKDGGKVRLEELLRCQVRYLSDGAVLGSQAFVMEMEAQWGRGRRRSSAVPRRCVLPVADAHPVLSLRHLRGRPVA